jgi:hypothetical protein
VVGAHVGTVTVGTNGVVLGTDGVVSHVMVGMDRVGGYEVGVGVGLLFGVTHGSTSGGVHVKVHVDGDHVGGAIGGGVKVVGSSGTVTGGNTLVGIEGVGGTKLVGTDVGGGIVVIEVWWITGRVLVVVNGVGPGITV